MSATKQMKRVLLGAILVSSLGEAKPKLPKGVVLPEGVVLPDDFELPAGIVIPEGFVITQDMVDQYLRYMENQKGGGKKGTDDNAWFKQIATSHENANLQMNVQKMDTAAANEEALFQDKIEESLMSKEVILPILAVVCVIIIIWAWMTKCGKRACCKRSSEVPSRSQTRKSVKSERTETTNNDIESGSSGSGNVVTELSMAGNSRQLSARKHGVSKSKSKLEVDAVPFERASEPEKPSVSIVTGAQNNTRNSNQLFGQTTANRNSLPTVCVPIQQIKSQRSRISGSNQDAISISRPSIPDSLQEVGQNRV